MPAVKVSSPSTLIRNTHKRLKKPPSATVSTSVSASTAAKAIHAPILGVPALGGAPEWKRIDCSVPFQEQSNWCWCATTLGVHCYYQPSDTTTQCAAANAILFRTDACANPTSPAVNIPYYLDRALHAFGHLRAPAVQSSLPTTDVNAEIDAATPVAARIGWAGGGGHFMLIVGYLAGTVLRLEIRDPIFGTSELDFDDFRTGYQGSGSWTHSYLIK